ncbi:AAA family ATPase [Photobacterium sanguinicancri]|uniref:AAA family ATPase n=1 Tax=Photobacterium sanguinicancri TaxID=875932 RepID=UPI002480655A|nr:AAA family ATPase [Photobacterium sanguinicancri]
MKLIRASFKNFRLLRDITIDFSVDEEKKLTVIRAENGTGKTTLMSALIWGLYGSDVLKDKLYPLSMVEDAKETTDIETEVRIDFLTEEATTRHSKTIVSEKHYRLVRKAISTVSNGGKKHVQSQDDYTLLESTHSGTQPVPRSQINSIIERTLPKHLKDIYFTDGDAALTFIESNASMSEKRIRVKKAIESLLSMKELESVIKNLKAIKITLAKQIDNTDYGAKLLEAEKKHQNNEEWIQGSVEELNDFIESKSNLDSELKRLNVKIENQLKLGDKSSLGDELKKIERQIDRTRDELKKAVSAQCDILNSKSLAVSLIGDQLTSAIEKLNTMNAKDKFPMQFIPVLKHAMSEKECLCGSSLDENIPEGKEKRTYMEKIINDCQAIDILNKRASDLFFTPDHYTKKDTSDTWYRDYDSNLASSFNQQATLQEHIETKKQKDAKFLELNDDLLNTYREQARITSTKIKEIDREVAVLTEEIKFKKENAQALKRDVESCFSKVGKNNKAGGKHLLTDQLQTIYENVFDVIKTTELEKVSDKMNDIFLSMIGSNSGLNPNGMMQGCRLTPEFDIQVLGPKNQMLNPDTELNGASRRAITLSFILALTKVSNVIAPNIIDTPLGMTSGLVKQSILRNLIHQGSQIIMFLTYDEIKGVEDIIDEYSGKTVTLSFTGHYPTMLKNEPQTQGESILCECNHSQCCSICERTDQRNMQYRG